MGLKQQMSNDFNATTEGMKRISENEVSGNHFNSGEVSDDPKYGEVYSGGAPEDAIPGGFGDIGLQAQMRGYVNVNTGGMETISKMIYQKIITTAEKLVMIKNGEVSGGVTPEDAIPDGPQGIGSQQPIQTDVNMNTERIETQREN